MIISLVGMSSAGKTYWAFELQKHGFTRITCDDLIEKRLAPELRKNGYRGLHEVAKWMGHPYEPQYPKTSKRYLDFETEVMEEIFDEITSMNGNPKKIVIDTTGSVIYTTGSVLKRLKEISSVIYLDIPEEKKQEIYQEFLRNPKPIIWGESYKPKEGETNEEALARCYQNLLSFRAKKYGNIADITIPFDIHRQEDFTASDFIEHIEAV
ncbi:hypothetical protein IPM65_05600 [Candidatus Roizmanbacteria bacterium]|nr:MAG: hypothetical protein IPM65_05600 [Candidatus Roizmanbacteria bacterium]